MDPLAILYSLVGPFLIWPLEYILPYPHIIEETFKLFVVKFTKGNIKTYILAGFVFALTETILYSININLLGRPTLFLARFISTSLLHSITFLIIFKFSKQKNAILSVSMLTGFLISILIHYLYNRYIPIY